MSKAFEQRLSNTVRQYLAEGGRLMGGLSDEDHEKRETAGLNLAGWLGRFQIEAAKATRSQKRKGSA